MDFKCKNKWGYMEISLIGKKFGHFEVKEFLGLFKKKNMWKCLCKCGNSRSFSTSHINANAQISCGCYKQKYRTEPRENKHLTKHGFATKDGKHPLYRTWRNIKHRCINEKGSDYKYYGGRGISICEEWKNNFVEFYNWAMKNNWVLGLSIDRINNDKDYEPDNCRFISKSENSRKRCLDNPDSMRGSKNHLSKLNEQQVIEIKKMIIGGIMLKDIAKIYNMPPNSISNIKTGKSWKHIVVTLEPQMNA